MKGLLTWLSRRRFPYEPLITVNISRGRLLDNLAKFRKLAPQGRVIPVLKSNAYGHGLYEVASILEQENKRNGNYMPFFAVDSYFEALALRAMHIHTPLLIIGYTRPETIKSSRLKAIAFAVTSMETLRALNKGISKPVHIHLKIDTGMRRQGIDIEEANEAMAFIQDNALENQTMVLDGIMSHLADADDDDLSFTEGQIKKWNNLVERFKAAFPGLPYIHLSNTDGHYFGGDIKANASRLGIGLYGLSDGVAFRENLDLKPVMEVKTILTGIKKIQNGESVGYSNAFVADGPMTIATIPFGYFEGLDRRLSSNGFILVGPERIACPIIGRISMNITSIDVSGVPDAKIGMTAIVISDKPDDKNSFQAMAKRCGTITYEGAVKIPEHLRREVVE